MIVCLLPLGMKFYAGTKNSVKTNRFLCTNDINSKVPMVGYKESSLASSIFLPARKGNVFTGVCLSMGGGVGNHIVGYTLPRDIRPGGLPSLTSGDLFNFT